MSGERNPAAKHLSTHNLKHTMIINDPKTYYTYLIAPPAYKIPGQEQTKGMHMKNASGRPSYLSLGLLCLILPATPVITFPLLQTATR